MKLPQRKHEMLLWILIIRLYKEEERMYVAHTKAHTSTLPVYRLMYESIRVNIRVS